MILEYLFKPKPTDADKFATADTAASLPKPDNKPREDQSVPYEKRDVIQNFAKLLPVLAQEYDQARLHFIKTGAVGKEYLEPTIFLKDLIEWSVTGTKSKLLGEVLAHINFDPEQVQILGALIRSQAEMFVTLSEQKDIDPNNVEKTKLASAQFNQQLSQFFFEGLQARRSSVEFQSAELVSILLRSIGKLGIREAMPIGQVVSGARAQAGLCQTFTEAGYDVLVPDFQNEQEIKDWDLKGADFVVRAPNGRIFLIDAKGRAMVESTNEFGRENTSLNARHTIGEEPIHPAHIEVAKQARDFFNSTTEADPTRNNDKLPPKRLVIVTPTNSLFMSNLGRIDQASKKIIMEMVNKLS